MQRSSPSRSSRTSLLVALVALVSASGCSTPSGRAGTSIGAAGSPPAFPPGVRVASPIAPEIRGAGVELIVVRVEASPAEIHDAIMAAGGQRDTTSEEWARGLEVVTLHGSAFEPLLRSLHPSSSPSVTWLGIPVRWRTALRNSACRLQVRGWPLSMEVGEAAVIDVIVDMPDGCRRERLLLPDQVLLMVPGGAQFPLPMGAQVTPGPLTSLMANAPVTVVAFRPRFQKAPG